MSFQSELDSLALSSKASWVWMFIFGWLYRITGRVVLGPLFLLVARVCSCCVAAVLIGPKKPYLPDHNKHHSTCLVICQNC